MHVSPFKFAAVRSDDEEFELDDVFDEEIQVTAVRTGAGHNIVEEAMPRVGCLFSEHIQKAKAREVHGCLGKIGAEVCGRKCD